LSGPAFDPPQAVEPWPNAELRSSSWRDPRATQDRAMTRRGAATQTRAPSPWSARHKFFRSWGDSGGAALRSKWSWLTHTRH